VTAIDDTGAGQASDRPTWGPIALAAFVALVVATNVAGVAWARLLESSPAQLLALSSRNRYLALALGADVAEGAYWIIGSARIAIAFVVLHLIGRAYHATALNWFTRYLGVDAEALDGFRRGYERAEWIVVPVFVGSNLVAAISGVHHTRWPRLVVLVGIGIIGRLALIRWLAIVFEEQLTDVVNLIQRYSWWAVGISVVLVLLVNVRNFRGGTAR
jgi:hypothetical protein